MNQRCHTTQTLTTCSSSHVQQLGIAPGTEVGHKVVLPCPVDEARHEIIHEVIFVSHILEHFVNWKQIKRVRCMRE